MNHPDCPRKSDYCITQPQIPADLVAYEWFQLAKGICSLARSATDRGHSPVTPSSPTTAVPRGMPSQRRFESAIRSGPPREMEAREHLGVD